MDRMALEEEFLLHNYTREIRATDKLPRSKVTHENIQPVLLGLMGEVGSIMAAAKKRHREPSAYVGYNQVLEEEFGDTLWYFATLCRRLGTNVASMFPEAEAFIPSSSSPGVLSPTLNETLLELGRAASALLDVCSLNKQTRDLLRVFSRRYLQALHAADLTFSVVVNTNIAKACGRFLKPDPTTLPTFDNHFPDDERLPPRFEIKIIQRESGQSYLQWNGVFLGDPLTDNISDRDAYRFHDMFHLANAAILHWSPVFRALIKHKRKSDSETDETQDSGRAIVVEEGLTAWIFSRAKELEFFKDPTSISFDMLKTVQQFVRGYEVEECPLKLWEKAILRGYEVFRQVRDNKGGIVVGNRKSRTINYRSFDGG